MLRTIAVAAVLAIFLAGCNVQPIPGHQGSYTMPLPEPCELWLFTPESHVGERAIALACPGVDLLRLYPWPPLQGWDESSSDAPAPQPTATPRPVPVI